MSRIQIWRPRSEVPAVKNRMAALSLAVSHVGIAASVEIVSAEPRIFVEPIAWMAAAAIPPAAAMDDEGAVDDAA